MPLLRMAIFPIETAPKDRTVLLFYPGNIDINDSAEGWIEGSWDEQEELWECAVGYLGDYNIPTHWAELPGNPLWRGASA
jgi:hypothetical protein